MIVTTRTSNGRRGRGWSGGLSARDAAAQRRRALGPLGEPALHELVERVDQRPLLARRKLAEDIGLDALLDLVRLRHLALPGGGDGDDARAAVVRGRAALGEAVALELVDRHH